MSAIAIAPSVPDNQPTKEEIAEFEHELDLALQNAHGRPDSLLQPTTAVKSENAVASSADAVPEAGAVSKPSAHSSDPLASAASSSSSTACVHEEAASSSDSGGGDSRKRAKSGKRPRSESSTDGAESEDSAVEDDLATAQQQQQQEQKEEKEPVLMAPPYMRDAQPRPDGIYPPPPPFRHPDSSTKVSAIIDLIRNIHCRQPSAKILVFSFFTSYLRLLQPFLDAAGYKHKYEQYDGSMEASTRRGVLERFKRQPSMCVCLMSLKAGCYGLNITCASKVILTESWWNPFVESTSKHARSVRATPLLLCTRSSSIFSVFPRCVLVFSSSV
jgi:hypothetical protein